MANIRDVAKKAGVGIATVSRYINSKGYVSKSVGEKIQLAIDELNYTPNGLARAIFTKSSNMIGLIIPSLANPFYPELAIGIENRAKELGYRIILSNTEFLKQSELDIIDSMCRHRVDGIIVANASCVKEYINCGIPVVSLEKQISPDIIHLSSDYYKGGRIVADYVLEKKFKKVLHIKGPDNIESAANRFLGFKDRLSKFNISVDIHEGMYGEDVEGIAEKLKAYEFVFVWNDDLAISVLNECYYGGVNIPKDIEIIGYDDIFYSRKTIPTLTTVGQSIAAMGEKAVDLLSEQIQNKAPIEKEYLFDVKLIHRNSTNV